MTPPSPDLSAGTYPGTYSVLPLFLDALRKHRRIVFFLADDLGGHHGLVNRDSALVLLDTHNTTGEMRATIAHELQHLVAPDATEEEVELDTARKLVPLDAALAAAESGDYGRVAETLRVDVDLVRARLRGPALSGPPAPVPG